MQKEVELREPRLQRYVYHFGKGRRRLGIRLAGQQSVAHIVDGVRRDARNARGGHQRQHVQNQIAMFAHNIERLTAQVDKVMELRGRPIAAIDHVRHVGGQHEGCAIAFEVAKHLGVAEKLAEIDVEQMARRFEHYVVVVPIADAQNVCGHTVSGARDYGVDIGKCNKRSR